MRTFKSYCCGLRPKRASDLDLVRWSIFSATQPEIFFKCPVFISGAASSQTS
jgi:hypothetical protein